MLKHQSSRPDLFELYQNKVLPVLFHRLDSAFPEFGWTRLPTGWSGVRQTHLGQPVANPETTKIHSQQPWGFVSEDGTAISWLRYINGGEEPSSDQFVTCVQKLANRSGLHDSLLTEHFSHEEQLDAHRRQRGWELTEAFVAYCHVAICSEFGQLVLHSLRKQFGLDAEKIWQSSLGVYTTHKDVRDHLLGMGFTFEEIQHSKITRDARLEGRLIIPWRDHYGVVRTIVARDPIHRPTEQARHLYWQMHESCDPLGLDVALQNASGGKENLILVEGILETIYLQTNGFPNVATYGDAGKLPSQADLKALSDCGVQSITLALADDDEGRNRSLQIIGRAYRADRSPRIYALPSGALGQARQGATLAHLQGMGLFKNLIDRRLHAFHFVADCILQKHRDADVWTDPGLVGTVQDAISFDNQIYTPKRSLELDQFFWPSILEATGADWSTVRYHLNRSPQQPITQENSSQHPKSSSVPSQSKLPITIPATVVTQTKIPQPNTTPPTVVNSTAITQRKAREPIATHPIESHTVPPKPVVSSSVISQPITTPSFARSENRQSKSSPSSLTHSQQPVNLPSRPKVVDIQTIAYLLWEQQGQPVGQEKVFWEKAEKILRQRQANGEALVIHNHPLET